MGLSWKRRLRYDRDETCKETKCSAACTCDACVGPGPDDCQGTCVDIDDDLNIIAAVVVGFIFMVLMMIFIHLSLHHQCGCRWTSKGGWEIKGRKLYPRYGPWEFGYLPELEDTKQYVPTQSGFNKPALADPFGDTDGTVTNGEGKLNSDVLDPFASVDVSGSASGLRKR